MSDKLFLASSTILALQYARQVSRDCKIPFISKEILLATIILMPDSPFPKYFSQKGLSDEAIQKNTSKIFINIPANCKTTTITLSNNDVFKIDENILRIFNKAKTISEKYYARNYIKVSDVIAGFAEEFPDKFEEIMLIFIPTFGSPASINKETYMDGEYALPPELENFLTVLNKKFSPKEKECYICGRDEETDNLVRILMKRTKRNVILVGEPGVGKTALAQNFTWMIVTGKCPNKLKDSIVISLDVNAIVADTHLRGSAEKRFDMLKKFLENNPNYILFIDEIHLLLGAGACREGELDLGNALKPILATGETRVIGATTINEYEQYFSKDAALKRRFEKIIVNEPKSTEVYPMIKNQVKLLEEYHNVTISRELIDFAILNASCFNFETKNPDRTLDLLDKSMACAELANRTKVTQQDVLDNFSVYKKKFNKMNIVEKTATAYHEAGHCILHEFSDAVSEYVGIAVSIMPAEKYLGINVSEIDHDATPTKNRKYYIQLLGCYLAGRIAEEMYSGELTAGAYSDLENATKLAHDVVTKYGLDEEFSKNRVFINDERNPMYTEQLISRINICVDKILEEANQYATNILNEKRECLEELASALLEHNIVSGKMLANILEKGHKVNE